MPQVENDPKIHYKYHLLWSVRSLQAFKCFFSYDVRLGTKSIITFRVVCFFCVKRQRVPATDEITGKHENQITPKPIILQPIFSEFLKNNFLLRFKTIWRFKINITYSNAKVVHHKKLIIRPEMKFDLVLNYTLPSTWPKSIQVEIQNDGGSLGLVIALQTSFRLSHLIKRESLMFSLIQYCLHFPMFTMIDGKFHFSPTFTINFSFEPETKMTYV